MVMLNLEVGGLERIVVDLAVRLAQQSRRVGVVTLRHGGPLAGQLRESGIEVTELGLSDGIRPANLFALRRHIRAFAPDVVHSHGEAALFYSSLSRFSGLRFRHVHTRHGYEDVSSKGRLRNRLSFAGCDAVVCVSSDLTEHCELNEGVHPSKLFTVLNGVNLAPYRSLPRLDYAPTAPVIGHVARLAQIKNQRLLLDSFALLRTALPNARLEIVGDGPLRAALQAHSDSLGLGDSVRFHGESDRVAEKLAICHIFCLSSDSEGTPVSVLEALTAGRPVVATNVGGLAEVVDAAAGVLCPAGNAAALAEGIQRVYATAEGYERFSSAARLSAAKAQDLESMFAAYLGIYEPDTATKGAD